jgi:predicted GIY-YIG superfamily endonuclease
LRGSAKVYWGAEQQQAFDDLKRYIKHLLTLSSPEQGQPLILYVSATHSAVSSALVVEKEIKQKDKIMKRQFLVYFVSEVLMGSNKFYSEMKNICYVVIMSSQKL